MCCCYFIIYYCLLYYFGEQSFEIDFSIKGEYAHGVVCQWPRSHTKFKASTVVHQIQFFRGFNLINKRYLKISTMSAKTNMIAFLFISHLPINSQLISLVRRYDHITASLALQSDFFLTQEENAEDLVQSFGFYLEQIGSSHKQVNEGV